MRSERRPVFLVPQLEKSQTVYSVPRVWIESVSETRAPRWKDAFIADCSTVRFKAEAL